MSTWFSSYIYCRESRRVSVFTKSALKGRFQLNSVFQRSFEVHQGGYAAEVKSPVNDYQAVVARIHFERLVGELLRALAHGSDPEHRVTTQIREFAEHAARMRVPVFQLVDEALQALNKTINPSAACRDEMLDVTLAGLLVAAENIADDPGARARASRRESELVRTIERYLVEQERRSRKSGWSYLNKLIHDWFSDHQPSKSF